MEKILGNFYIENNKLVSVDKFPETENDAVIVYEVIRVENNVPIFYEEHFKRLASSIVLAGFDKKQMKSNTRLFIQIERVIAENKIANGNIKLGVLFKNNELLSVKVYFIPYSYPAINEYTNGVQLVTHKAERKNPNVKIRNRELRNKTNKLIKQHNVYEVLLYGSNNILTEGSRSNIFFIKNEVIYTSPDDLILKGITWEYVQNICNEIGIKIVKKQININDIAKFDSVFLTGTSPKIIMVNKIDNFEYKNSEIIKNISREYNKIIDSFTEKFTRCRI